MHVSTTLIAIDVITRYKRHLYRDVFDQNVDIVPVDLSGKFSLASPTHLVLFLEDILILFLDFMLVFPKFHCLLTKCKSTQDR